MIPRMTADQLAELLRKYVSTGLAVVVVLVGAAATPGADGKPQVPSGSAAASSSATPRTATPKHTRTAKPTPTDTPTPTDEPTDSADPADSAEPSDTADAGEQGTTAAAKFSWGAPDRADDFSSDLSGWGLYDGPGHAGNGKRSAAAVTVANGLLTIRGDAQGTTGGMAWNNGKGRKYGRWEARVKAPAGDPTYNAVLLLWPDAENFPIGGEIDFAEMTDATRRSTNVFLHHGAANDQVHGAVKIDATQWHNWAVEWTPEGVTTFVDGRPWWHTADTAILPPGPMHLCVQLDWFPRGGAAVTPSQMQVDWVREYPVDGGAPQTTAPAGS